MEREILWEPSKSAIINSRMTIFEKWLSEKFELDFSDYESLHHWSTENIEQFWESFLEFSGIIYSQSYHDVLNNREMPGAKWFSGMKLNYAENILAKGFDGQAIVYCLEGSAENKKSKIHIGSYSYPELGNFVARCARGLTEAGVKKGDIVAGYIANVPEAIIACLASAAIGATWSSTSPDFGFDALCDRIIQIKPRIVFASTHYQYNGKIFRTDDVVKKMGRKIPSIEKVITIPYPVGTPNIIGDGNWDEFLGPDDNPRLNFAQVPFDHPLYILFSSGTTGIPKCIVHGTGGTLLQHRKEQDLHCDIRIGDSLFYFTTCGWMMWNWQVSALSLGATIFLYDGSPVYPDINTLWKLVKKLNITHFGTSGKFIETCMKHRPPLKKDRFGDMSRLRTILYTGSPLSANGFRWIYQNIKGDLHLAGISGGTDIVSCFVLGNPNLPVIAGEIQCKGLGIDVVAFDEDGKTIIDKPGELVCRKPVPSMPIRFLNDLDDQKYRAAYFIVYPGVWHHGDYIEFNHYGGIIIYGRSDATLNPGGVRIGSAEIYSALDHIDKIAGAVTVGWKPPWQSDEVIILFVVLSSDKILDEKMEKTIQKSIRVKCSPRHVPYRIFNISEIPVTRSGKTVELSVRAILEGKNVTNRNALANPNVLIEIEKIRHQLVESSNNIP